MRLLALLSGILWGAATPSRSALVYYGGDLSWPLAGTHDYIIVEPSQIATDTHGFRRYRDKVYAYVSLGEMIESDPRVRSLHPDWILGKNTTWKSLILNLDHPGLRRFLLDRVIAPLYRRGFRRFFFDTLDAHRSVVKESDKRTAQEKGLAALLRELHRRWPDTRIILNRGFDLLDRLPDMVDAILFESYFYGLDSRLRYRAIDPKQRRWLDGKLREVRRRGLDIIALDYLPDPSGPQARRLAEKLAAKGFIPYVGDRDLHRYGTSSRQAIKRELLLLYDGSAALPYQPLHRYASMPVEYLGYVPILKDIRTARLSPYDYERYAGAIVWTATPLKDPAALYRWVRANARRGMYTLFLGSFAADLSRNRPALKTLGITLRRRHSGTRSRPDIEVLRPWMHDETTPVIQDHPWMIRPPRGSRALLRYRQGGQSSTLAALTPWGGYALGESATVEVGGERLWSADPFTLFSRALRLRKFPIPDPTTENGLRLFFSHIDGDGFANRAEWDPTRLCGEIIDREILKKYPTPHSVSLIVGEVIPEGLYPKLSARLIRLARSIYALPNVEAASHTFSHPFFWSRLTPDGTLPPSDRLDIPGYRFSLERELRGSLEYINTLLPPGKPRSRTLFWSGDALPGTPVLRKAYQWHLLTINGGKTSITNAAPWLGRIAPFGLRRGRYWQIYAGAASDDLYTHSFRGPLWGYRNAIQTFELTEHPRRLKPIDIHYRFTLASREASLVSLKEVFDWAMRRETFPLYTSEYIPKVMEFYDASLAPEGAGGYRIDGLEHLRTLRLEANATRLPDLNASSGILGYRQLPQGTYLSLEGNGTVHLRLGRTPALQSRLISANGRLLSRRGTRYTFQAHLPLRIRWRLAPGCRLEADPVPEHRETTGEEVLLQYTHHRKATIHVRCP